MKHEFDYIIVGAGSAGCVLANRLSAQPDVSVLLLEAGASDRHPLIQMPAGWLKASATPAFIWGYQSEPEPYADNRVIPLPRGKMLGGSGSINGLMYIRGQAADYDGWNLPGWRYQDVLPYFKRSEDCWRGAGPVHGTRGELTVSKFPTDPYLFPRLMETAQRLGHQPIADFNLGDNEGFSLADFNIHKGRRGSTYALFVHGLRRPNLRVESRALTERILIENARATGVEYRQGGELKRVHATREVIVCGGTMNSPQLLLLSGIGPADELRALGINAVHDLPGVGRNLQEHPMVLAAYEAAGPITYERELRLDRLALSVLRWQLTHSGPLCYSPLALQGFVRSSTRVPRADLQFQISHVSFLARPWFPGLIRGAGHQLSPGAVLLRPQSRGSITLRTANAADAPRIRLNFLQAESDRLALRAAFKFIREFFATAPANTLVAKELMPGPVVTNDDSIDAYVRASVASAAHPACSCAMGIGGESVVDPELRVHGIERLRVVDASILPNLISGNTNAPAIMIAEKAADLILGRPAPVASA